MLSNNHQPSTVCKHGRSKIDPQFTGYTCELCAEENFLSAARKVYATEREELVKEFMLAHCAADGANMFTSAAMLQWAIDGSDTYLQWRDEERRK